MTLVLAEGTLLEDIIDATFPLWNEGLTPSGYAQWNAAQMRTPWGQENLHRFALPVTASARRLLGLVADRGSGSARVEEAQPPGK